MRTTILLLVLVASITTVATVSIVPQDAVAQSYYPRVTSTPINDEITLQKTEVILSVPQDNVLPWGFVTGQEHNYVPDYPAIIQFHKDGEAVHFAQVDINNDGSYEYKFRALSVDLQTGYITHVFEGDYVVSIFTVVPNTTTSTLHDETI